MSWDQLIPFIPLPPLEYIMFLDPHSLNLPAMAMLSASDEEFERMSTSASHVCPNCDGDITIAEHKHLGVCDPCYYGTPGTAAGH